MPQKRKAPVRKATPLGQDVVQLILEDHKPLKKLLKIMKSDEASMKDRKEAFKQFEGLLVLHARTEEQSLYNQMKTQEPLRRFGFEGDVEHGLADQMLEEAKRTTAKDLFAARVKVLAELVEHHIEEEEKEILPKVKKEMEISARRELGELYLQVKDMVRKERRAVQNASLLEQRASH